MLSLATQQPSDPGSEATACQTRVKVAPPSHENTSGGRCGHEASRAGDLVFGRRYEAVSQNCPIPHRPAGITPIASWGPRNVSGADSGVTLSGLCLRNCPTRNRTASKCEEKLGFEESLKLTF
ncbi:unnamed protein product [Protopolystoma xenopodis]|uniref:Uncharacterized protein n=1 Tax=Protopolystoma xenopodis TaxID=117903 RepID=A0A3S5CLQ7_9PLAT|nr:unnamed protein product [Protopolystoma xenopodis]